MGVAMSLKPPATKRMGWVWFAAFLIIGLIAIVASVKDRQNADAEQSELKKTIDGLRDTIDKLTQPIGKAVGATTRDPDTIYQNGAAAGHVVGARITLNQSQVYFDQIENAGNLDQSKTFEYRDYVLRLVRADSYIGMLVSPSGVATNVYQHVVCEIVGRTH